MTHRSQDRSRLTVVPGPTCASLAWVPAAIALHLPRAGYVTDSAGFVGLVLRLRGATGLTQREVAARLGLHVRSVQLWEAGASHPSPQRLQGLISVFLDAGGFADGAERDQAEALWGAAESESNRFKASFDQAWFTGLLIDRATRTSYPASSEKTIRARQHWGEAPDVAGFLGRRAERELLRRWIVEGGSRLVAITALGGTGKTLLAARAVHDLAPHFDWEIFSWVRSVGVDGSDLAFWLRHGCARSALSACARLA